MNRSINMTAHRHAIQQHIYERQGRHTLMKISMRDKTSHMNERHDGIQHY